MMTASTWTQIHIALWKWWLLHKKQPILVLAQLLWPCLILCALVWLHPLARPGAHTSCYFHARANPSVGLVPYFQTTMCNLNNMCFDKGRHQDIPTFPNSSFVDIVLSGEPLFNSNEVKDGILALPQALTFLSAAVKVMDDPFTQEILDDNVKVFEMLKNTTRIGDFLMQNGGLTSGETDKLINATLKLANIFIDFGGQALKPVACQPEKLANYLITDETEAVLAISQALCNLDNDQINRLVDLIQTNIDIESLIQRGENLVNKTSAYGPAKITNDVTLIIQAILNMTIFQDMTSVPAVLNTSLWRDDFESFLASMLDSDQEVDYQIVDTMTSLMLQPETAQMAQNISADVSHHLKTILDWINEKDETRKKRQVVEKEPQGFSMLASQLERLSGFVAEALEVVRCLLYLDQTTCSDVNELLNAFMAKYPNIQCSIEKLGKSDKWIIMNLDEFVVNKIFETILTNSSIFNWNDFETCKENVRFGINGNLTEEQMETGKTVLCGILYEPFQLLPEFIKNQDTKGCLSNTLDLYQLFKFGQELQNVISSVWKGFMLISQTPPVLLPSQLNLGNQSLGFNVTMIISDLIITEAQKTLEGIKNKIDVGLAKPIVFLPLSVILPKQPITSEYINVAAEVLLVILRDWSTQVSNDNLIYVREAIGKSINVSSCPESIWALANFTSSNVINKSQILCEVDDIVHEWLNYDLLVDIFTVVREALETGSCKWNESNLINKASTLIHDIVGVSKSTNIVVPEAVLVTELWHEFYWFISQVFEKLINDNKGMDFMTDYYSKMAPLDQVLQCWKGYHDESQVACKSIGDLARFGAYVSEILKEIDSQYDNVFVKFLNDSGIFEIIAHSTSVIKSFGSVMNMETLETLLAETQLEPEIIQLLLDAYINLNRLIFKEYNVTADMIDNKMEFQRLIKFDDLNDVAKVGIATKKANKAKIAMALQKSLEMDEVAVAIEKWKNEEVASFHWLEQAFQLAQVIMDDSIDIFSASSDIIRLVSGAGSDKYLDLINGALDLFSQGKIDALVDGILEIFATTDVMIGNDPMAQNVQILLEGLQQLEIYQIMTMLQFETSLDSLFKDWQGVENFLQQLNLSSKDIKAVQKAELNIPGILTNSKGIGSLSSLPAKLLCDDLAKYIHLNSTDDEEIDIQSKLCNLTESKKLFELTKVFLEELQLDKLVQLSLIIDNILMESDLTRDEFNDILNKLEISQAFLDDNWNLVTDLMDIFQPVWNSTNSTTTRELGLLICDDPEAFNLAEHSGFSFGSSAKSLPQKSEKTSCQQLSEELNESEEGKFLWKAIAPYLAGDILYTPVNDLTEAIIKEANRSASKVGDIMSKASAFMTLGSIGMTITTIEKDLLDAQKILSSSLLTQIINSTDDNLDLDIETFINANVTDLVTQLLVFENMLKSMELIGKASDCYKINRFVGVSNESALEAEAMDTNGDGKSGNFLAGLVFLPSDTNSHHVQYKIRMSKDFVPSSAELKADFWVPGPDSNYIQDLKYASGFLQLQDLIDRAIMRHAQNQLNWQDYNDIDLENIGVYTQEFPYPCFVRENFLSGLYTTQMLNVAIVIGFALLVGASIRQQIWEKESLNAMVLEVMGYNLTINWTVWFVINLVMATTISGLVTIILTQAGLLHYSDPLVVFLFLSCSSLATVSFCFMMSSVMSKAVVGSIVSLIFYIMSFTPFMGMFTLSSSMIKLWPRLLASLLMTSCFGFGFNYITTYEQQSIGMLWSNASKSPVKGDALNLAYCCLMLLFDALLYSSVAVISILIERRSKRTSSKASTIFPQVQGESSDTENNQKVVGVALKNLTKVFQGAAKDQDARIAVNGISVDFYVNEVTALLGHNGAGKSTLIKMFSGMLEPSSGSAEILGFDTWTQWTQVQSLLGICPQQSILYPTLSPTEHLSLYGSLKGILNSADLKQEISNFLKFMEMQRLAHVPVRNLSEGMKRRLCVALAFIGGSKVVILDEPTSGVDPIARRHIWNLINQFKHGKTIIFTTHHLDEAELLSDKLVMIHKGTLMASGTVAELKQQFGGCGFDLIVNHGSAETDIDFAQLVKNSVENATELPKRHENDTHCSRFKLPLMKDVNSEEYNQLEMLFAMLDNEKEKLAIESYTLECTSLEQIFLKMQDSSLEELQLDSDTESNCSKATSDSCTDSVESVQLIRNEALTGASLLWNQIKGLLQKRWLHSKRDWRYVFTILILPTLLLALSMGLGLLAPSGDLPPLLLTPSIYGPFSNSFIQMNNEDGESMEVMQQFLQNPGIGTSCMNDLVNMSTIQVECQDSLEKNFSSVYEGPGPMSQKCTCDYFIWSCQAKSDPIETPQRWIMNSTDVLFDLGNISDANDWLLQTHKEFIDTRFGGWSIGSSTAKDSSWINGTGMKLIAWYNNKAPHALPSYTNAIHNAMLRSLIKDPQKRPLYGISTFSHPMKIFNGQLDSESLMQRLSSYGVSLMVLLSVGFLPSGFITYVIAERKAEEKQVQLVSGVSKLTYWSMTFLWNLGTMLIFLVVCIALFYGFALSPYIANQNLPAVCTLILAFWIDCAALSYLLESFFNEPSFGQLFIICSNILIGLVTLLTNLILQMLWWNKTARALNNVLSKLFLIFPQFALGGGLLKLTTNQVQSEILAIYDIESYENPFSMNIIGLNILTLLLEALFFHIAHMMLEFGWIRLVTPARWLSKHETQLKEEEDDDVAQERKRIEAEADNDVLRIENLTKVFHRPMGDKVFAVDHVTVGIKPGECFGWLGLNGAGKSTTFKLLTGQMEATSGSFSLRPNQSMGYCPQTDALDPYLTVKETLHIYAKLKGIPGHLINQVVDKSMRDLDLTGHSGNRCQNLSGGTKRKLCTAVALLGSPELILMDEPTSGMDAVTKRLVWRRIQREIAFGDSAVVLTSHSMEECEFLCTRIAIMAQGKFKCLGSPSHLMNKFGNGYSVSLHFGQVEALDEGMAFVASRFPMSSHVQRHNLAIQFRVANEPPSVIFAHILANKESLDIQDFAVRHTTLDEVFVNFANDDEGRHSKNDEYFVAKLLEEEHTRRPPSGASQSASMSIDLPDKTWSPDSLVTEVGVALAEVQQDEHTYV